MNHLEFRNDGKLFIDHARCFACRTAPADTELLRDGDFVGYVCADCVRAAQAGGMDQWKHLLHRREQHHRALANHIGMVASALPDDAALVFRLAIRSGPESNATVISVIGGDE